MSSMHEATTAANDGSIEEEAGWSASRRSAMGSALASVSYKHTTQHHRRESADGSDASLCLHAVCARRTCSSNERTTSFSSLLRIRGEGPESVAQRAAGLDDAAAAGLFDTFAATACIAASFDCC